MNAADIVPVFLLQTLQQDGPQRENERGCFARSKAQRGTATRQVAEQIAYPAPFRSLDVGKVASLGRPAQRGEELAGLLAQF